MFVSNKNIFIFIALAIIIGHFLSSCSNSIALHKRKYRQGYYVDIAKNKNSNNTNKDYYQVENTKSPSAAARLYLVAYWF